MTKPILISGVQPTGKLHIGNYLGALQNFVELQNSGKYQCYFFIADLHSLTEDFNPKEKQKQILDLAADFLAAGLDPSASLGASPQKSVIFIQSQIPEHTELSWIFNIITPFGELSRMTQFKDKSENQKHNINVGLFDYPVLMAADILLYKPQFVPVGEDQKQHLEFARMLARKFNNKFGKTFPEPKAILTKAPRVMSLDNPKKKMSKSLPKGCLYLSDSPKVIREKIKAAATDSYNGVGYDSENRPGISNLLLIYSEFANVPIPEIVKKFKGVGYADFKAELAEIVIKVLKPFQNKRAELIKNPKKVMKILEEGAKRMRPIANSTMKEVKERVGLV